jgi:hypothetical protein
LIFHRHISYNTPKWQILQADDFHFCGKDLQLTIGECGGSEGKNKDFSKN